MLEWQPARSQGRPRHELGGPEGTVAGRWMVLTGIFNLLLAPLLLRIVC